MAFCLFLFFDFVFKWSKNELYLVRFLFKMYHTFSTFFRHYNKNKICFCTIHSPLFDEYILEHKNGSMGGKGVFCLINFLFKYMWKDWCVMCVQPGFLYSLMLKQLTKIALTMKDSNLYILIEINWVPWNELIWTKQKDQTGPSKFVCRNKINFFSVVQKNGWDHVGVYERNIRIHFVAH